MFSIVDDLLCGYFPESAEAMSSVLQQLLVGKEEHNNFRFLRKRIPTDEDFGIHATAKENTERVQPITHNAKHDLTRNVTADEIHQPRYVTQSFAWIAKQTRPDFKHRILKI